MPSPVWRRVRQVGLERVFGAGPAGFVAASAVGWLTDQLRDSRQPERLDTARLVPGETYLVTTRPPMNRTERRDAKRLRVAQSDLARESQPTRSVRRTARKLTTAQRKAAKVDPESRRGRKKVAKAAALGERFDRLTVPSAKQLKLERRVAELSVRMERHRAAALTAVAKGSKRTPRTKVFD